MDEPDRLASLRSYRILDTDPEQGFDDLALLASQICGTPMAAITLVDEQRQWFKARVGLTKTETSRSISFCSHAIAQPDMMVVTDALEDARFRQNPMVQGEPHIRFYAGARLVTPQGAALGTLCVVDRVPRELTAAQRQALDALRRQAEAQLELRRNLLELRRQLTNVHKLAGLMQFCSTCQMNLTLPAVPSSIETVSDGITQMLQDKGWSEDEIIKVDLALQEALANGIRHGCKGDPTKFIQCLVTTDAAGDLMIVVRDPGPGFDPAQVADPLTTENILKSSGRGVFLINQLMDEVAFRDGGREVQMWKRKVAGH
jgi:anti-sigma regulatory factor (Ser/Thr protein kinase)